jgi:opacity protein-like surface antigen
MACSIARLSGQTASAATPTEPAVRLRAFVLATEQRFAAGTTFNATLGSRNAPFFGGGLEVVMRRGLFVDATVSHLDKTGQRAFVNNGQIFQLGIPLEVTLTPVEVSGGYRLSMARHARVIPYAGAGVGWYSYRETSDFASSGENVDTTHAGFLVVGGVEVRLQKWIRAAADAQYTVIPGILGQGGLSKDLSEKDLGGLAARIRVILGL